MLVSLSSSLLAIHFCSQMSMSVAMATMFAMLIPTVTTQMVLIFVPVKMDTLEVFKTSSFKHKLSPIKTSPHFRDLFLRTTLIFLLRYLLYITYASRYR